MTKLTPVAIADYVTTHARWDQFTPYEAAVEAAHVTINEMRQERFHELEAERALADQLAEALALVPPPRSPKANEVLQEWKRRRMQS